MSAARRGARGGGSGRSGGEGRKLVASNRKARFNFEILESFEAGLELRGSEVKSLRDGGASFTDSYARFQGQELFLFNLNVAPYAPAAQFSHEPTRPRRLLLHRRELGRLLGKLSQGGATLVPLSVYFRGGWAKVELGLARHRARADRRQAIRERETRRELDRARKAGRR